MAPIYRSCIVRLPLIVNLSLSIIFQSTDVEEYHNLEIKVWDHYSVKEISPFDRIDRIRLPKNVAQ